MKDVSFLEDELGRSYHEIDGDRTVFLGEAPLRARRSPIDQTNPACIRWVQESLNRILGLRLPADGRMAIQTRSAIRSFQQKRGLKVDGFINPATGRAIHSALRNARFSPSHVCDVVDRFGFATAMLLPEHRLKVQAVASSIRAKEATFHPLRAIDIIGHTDPVGSESANYRLGCLRAWAVTGELKKALGAATVGRIKFRIASQGEKQPIPGDDAASRRVEIWQFAGDPPPWPVRCDLQPKTTVPATAGL